MPTRSLLLVLMLLLAALCVGPRAGAQAPTPNSPVVAVGEFLNVRALGAVGDGKADDTAVLQRALDSAGQPDPARPGQVLPTVLFFPPGLYRVTAPLTLQAAHRVTRIIGSGSIALGDKAPSQLVYDGPPGQPLLDCHPYSGLRIEELTFNGGDKAGVLLRVNSIPGYGSACYYVERVIFLRADTGIETGAEMDMCASDMSFVDLSFEKLKSCGFRAMAAQNVDFTFHRCSVGETPLGYHFKRGGNGHFTMPTFYKVNTAWLIEDGGINNGTFSITGLQLENFRYDDPHKRITVLDAKGEVNVAFNSIFVGCINVWGPERDLSPNFILRPSAQVTVRDSMLSGKVAVLTSDPRPGVNQVPTFIVFDNCRFRCASDPRKDIICDERSGFELRNCQVTLDDTLAKDYGATLRPLFIRHFLRAPRGMEVVDDGR